MQYYIVLELKIRTDWTTVNWVLFSNECRVNEKDRKIGQKLEEKIGGKIGEKNSEKIDARIISLQKVLDLCGLQHIVEM